MVNISLRFEYDEFEKEYYYNEEINMGIKVTNHAIQVILE